MSSSSKEVHCLYYLEKEAECAHASLCWLQGNKHLLMERNKEMPLTSVVLDKI